MGSKHAALGPWMHKDVSSKRRNGVTFEGLSEALRMVDNNHFTSSIPASNVPPEYEHDPDLWYAIQESMKPLEDEPDFKDELEKTSNQNNQSGVDTPDKFFSESDGENGDSGFVNYNVSP